MPFYDLIYKKLGFKSDTQLQSYAGLVGLFTSSDRGESAISIFTNNIMDLLISRNHGMPKDKRLSVEHSREQAMALFRQTKPAARAMSIFRVNIDEDTLLTPSYWSEWKSFVKRTKLQYFVKENVFMGVMVILQIFLWLENFNYYRVEGTYRIVSYRIVS